MIAMVLEEEQPVTKPPIAILTVRFLTTSRPPGSNRTNFLPPGVPVSLS